jgi:hypothetical protein
MIGYKQKYTSCKIDECKSKGKFSKKGTEYFPNGFCAKHNAKYKKYGDPNISINRTSNKKYSKCKIKGCAGSAVRGFRLGYCDFHYVHDLKHGNPNIIINLHGESRSKNPLYSLYHKIKQRCYLESSKVYKYYGGRGIKMCKRWLGVRGFSNFLKDMGERLSKNHSIDRINVNGDYTPKNCRWATKNQQASNTRSNNKDVGVSFDKLRDKWISGLTINKIAYRKRFKLYEDAIAYRKELENKYLTQ